MRIFSYSRGALQETQGFPYYTTYPEFEWAFDGSVPSTYFTVYFAGAWTEYYDSWGHIESDYGFSGFSPASYSRDDYHEYLVWKSNFRQKRLELPPDPLESCPYLSAD